jgi:hypothetical protein
MAVKYEGIWIVNIYAPSGAERRAERGQFFNTELMYILPQTNADVILAGDFNCIIEKSETTGGTNYSTALNGLITGLGLKDGWDPKTMKGGYTHMTAQSASRIDRIYTTPQLTARKTGIETIPAAFSDHNAVIIRIATDKRSPTRGRGYWKMNTLFLQEKTVSEKLAEEWANLLTPSSRVPLEMLLGSVASQEIPAFSEPEGSSLYPQAPATCPYPEPTPSSHHNFLPLPEDPS